MTRTLCSFAALFWRLAAFDSDQRDCESSGMARPLSSSGRAMSDGHLPRRPAGDARRATRCCSHLSASNGSLASPVSVGWALTGLRCSSTWRLRAGDGKQSGHDCRATSERLNMHSLPLRGHTQLCIMLCITSCIMINVVHNLCITLALFLTYENLDLGFGSKSEPWGPPAHCEGAKVATPG